MVGRDHGDRGDAMKRVSRDLGRQRAGLGGHRVQQFGVGYLSRRLNLQPVGRIMTLGPLRSMTEWPPPSTTSVSQ